MASTLCGSWRPATSSRPESPEDAWEGATHLAEVEVEEEQQEQEDSTEAAAVEMEGVGEAAAEVIKVPLVLLI